MKRHFKKQTRPGFYLAWKEWQLCNCKASRDTTHILFKEIFCLSSFLPPWPPNPPSWPTNLKNIWWYKAKRANTKSSQNKTKDKKMKVWWPVDAGLVDFNTTKQNRAYSLSNIVTISANRNLSLLGGLKFLNLQWCYNEWTILKILAPQDRKD